MCVIVAGAGGGIGRAVVTQLHDRDIDVVGLDIDGDALDELPPAIETKQVDLRDSVAVQEAIEGVAPDAVISCVGWYQLSALEECSPAELSRHLETNVVAVHTLVHATLPALRQREGKVVLVGSMVGAVPLPYHGAYSTAKAGLAGYADALRREMHPYGVSVSLVEPGPVRTGLNERAAENLAEKVDSPYRKEYRSFDGYRPRSTGVETVARTVVEATQAPSPNARYRVGRRARWLPRVQWLLPSPWFDRLVRLGLPSGILGKLIDGNWRG